MNYNHHFTLSSITLKQLFLVLICAVLAACEDNYETIHRYSKIISQTKNYDVYLDTSDLELIKVKANSSVNTPFKILSNERFFFVGDRMKGIHVYEITSNGVQYLCFIECPFLKDFELIENTIICNNFIDLVLIDVTNPLQSTLIQRFKNHFNSFEKYAAHWNFQQVNGKGIIVGSQTHMLTGTVTDQNPLLDFSSYDELYGNLTTKEVPASWITGAPEYAKPYVGIVNPGTNEVYTFGKYNSWAIGTLHSGMLSIREVDLWTKPGVRYTTPYYFSDAFPFRMTMKDSVICILGKGQGENSGYAGCILPHATQLFQYHAYFPDFVPVDVTYFTPFKAFIVLSGNSLIGAYRHHNPSYSSIERYKDYKITTSAKMVFEKDYCLVTIGEELSVYKPLSDELQLVKIYPQIQGICYQKSGNQLVVANLQGIKLYDISDLENIQLLP